MVALNKDLGHDFKVVGKKWGIEVSICSKCLETCKDGDTIYNTCPGSSD